MGREKYFVCKLLLLVSIFHGSVASAAHLSHPNCQEYCGNVRIPYPFGIRNGCYMNKWYKVICNKTGAFLESIHQEVTDISLPDFNYSVGRIEVKSPIISSGCPSGLPKGPNLNLTGSPFFISQLNNFFTIGCNITASMTDTASALVGCKTTCGETEYYKINDGSRQNATCNGYRCCQIGILYGLQAFEATINGRREGCKAAFLSQDTFTPSNWSHLNDVPMLLDWYLNEPTHPGFDRGPLLCYNPTITGVKSTSLYSCRCKAGYVGNPYLPSGCDDVDECTEERYNLCWKHTWPIILGFSLGFGLLFLVTGIWGLCIITRKRKAAKLKRKFFKRNGGLLLQQHLSSKDGNIEKTRIFSLRELEKATENFSENRILGQGGQGTVYKGIFRDGRIVAVKKSKVVDEDNMEEFINEVFILSQINHRNVVKILGCCLETEVPILVYEFIPNGNLFQLLHDQSDEFLMTWKVRLRVAVEIASAVSYLHSAASPPIYHRDIKTTNVLLDETYRAKVSDFGTSRSITIDQTHLTTIVQGTIGYVDPEYIQTSQFTEKSDVYSFGVVLVELLTGEEPVSILRPQEERILATHFNLAMKENKLFEILDKRILEKCDLEEVKAVANLARRCLSKNGKSRPTMREVSMELERIQSSKTNSQVQIQNGYDAEEISIDVSASCNPFYSARTLDYGGTFSSFDSDPLFPQKTF